MKRQSIDGGGWFDLDAATKYEESSTWNGQNHVSDATGSWSDHEELFETKGGSWIVHHWSQWQGSTDLWREIAPQEAAEWLIRCGHELPESLAAVGAELEK